MKKILLVLSAFVSFSVFAGYDFDGQKVFFREWHLWYQTIIEMPGVKRSEFVLLDNTPSGIYGKDKQNVYVSWKIIPGADPATVEYLWPYMIKDKNAVYEAGVKKIWPDPATFKIYNWETHGHLYMDKFWFYNHAERIVIAGGVYPKMSQLHTYSEWIWDDENVFVAPKYSAYIERIDFLNPNKSMGIFVTPFNCVVQDGDVYCPIVFEFGQQVQKMDIKYMEKFTRFYSQVMEQKMNRTYQSAIEKKIKKISDTQEKREILRGILEEKLLWEMRKGIDANQKKMDLFALIYGLID